MSEWLRGTYLPDGFKLQQVFIVVEAGEEEEEKREKERRLVKNVTTQYSWIIYVIGG